MEEVTGCALGAAASRLEKITPPSINQCIPLLGSCSEKHNLCAQRSTKTLELSFTAQDGDTKEQKGFFLFSRQWLLSCNISIWETRK